MDKKLANLAHKMLTAKTGRQIVAVIALSVLTGCASLPRATKDGELKSLWTKISTKDFIRVRGVGAVPPGVVGRTAKRGASRNAALVAARYELLAVIKGVRVSGGVTVAQLSEKDSIVRELANDLVKGGEEVQTEWLRDSGCVITLELRRATVERLIQEKSEREKGLERRVAKDIKEIAKLNKLLAVAIHSGIKDADPCEVEAVRQKAETLKRYIEEDDAIDAGIATGYQPDVNDVLHRIKRMQDLINDDPKAYCR